MFKWVITFCPISIGNLFNRGSGTILFVEQFCWRIKLIRIYINSQNLTGVQVATIIFINSHNTTKMQALLSNLFLSKNNTDENSLRFPFFEWKAGAVIFVESDITTEMQVQLFLSKNETDKLSFFHCIFCILACI